MSFYDSQVSGQPISSSRSTSPTLAAPSFKSSSLTSSSQSSVETENVALSRLVDQTSPSPPSSINALHSVQYNLLPPSPIPGQPNTSSSITSPPPFPRWGFSASATANGDVYIFGGSNYLQQMNDLYLYSTKKNTMTLVQCSGDVPSPRGFHSSVIIGDALIVWGGNCKGHVDDDRLYLLHLDSYEWMKVTVGGPGPGARFKHTMTAIGTSIFVFGGLNRYATLTKNEVWAFDIKSIVNYPTWKLIESFSSLCRLGGSLSTDIWSFNVTTRQWTKLRSPSTSFPSPIDGTAIIDGVAYFYCNNGSFGALKLSTQEWFTLSHLTAPTNTYLIACMVATATKLFLFASSDQRVHVLDTKNIEEPDLHETRRVIQDSRELSETRLGEHRSEMAESDVKAVQALEREVKTTRDAVEREAKAMRALEGEVKGLVALEAEVTGLRGRESEVQALRGSKAGTTELQELKVKVDALRELETEASTLRELKAEVAELRALETEVTELRGLRAEVVELRGLKAEVTELRELKAEVAKLRGLNAEMAELRGLKMEAIRLRKLEAEVTELRELKAEVAELRKFRAEVTQVQELQEEVAELVELVYRAFFIPKIVASARKSFISSLADEDAQLLIDFLTKVLTGRNLLWLKSERKRVLKVIPKLAELCQVYPKKFELDNVECDINEPVDGGGYGSIFKGTLNGQAVCIKAVRMYKSGAMRQALKANAKELALAAIMSHPNIIPFYGVYSSAEKLPRLCLVSPWMEGGNLAEHLEKFPGTPPIPLATDIIAGLRYMHDWEIVHSDLKAANVLISRAGRAMLADFGISTVAASQGDPITTQETAGTFNWMAPELLLGDGDAPETLSTKKSDIWAFGCVCFQLSTGKRPFEAYRLPGQMIQAFARGHITPVHPGTKVPSPGVETFQGPLLSLAEACWERDPNQRPTAEEAYQTLVTLNTNDNRPSQDEESAMFPSLKAARSDPSIDYVRLFSIFQRI